MGSPLEKQFLQLVDRPLLAHTLEPFQGCHAISRIILVVPEDRQERVRQEILLPFSLTKVKDVVPGGPTRQESVFLGLKAARDPNHGSIVVIHDGVRPIIDEGMIMRCVQETYKWGAAVYGLPSTDTLAQVDTREELFLHALDREDVWRIQTPQGFYFGLIMQAHEEARRAGFLSTDDATLVRRLDHPVRIIKGSTDNIKVTTRLDLEMAEFLMRRRIMEDRN